MVISIFLSFLRLFFVLHIFFFHQRHFASVVCVCIMREPPTPPFFFSTFHIGLRAVGGGGLSPLGAGAKIIAVSSNRVQFHVAAFFGWNKPP